MFPESSPAIIFLSSYLKRAYRGIDPKDIYIITSDFIQLSTWMLSDETYFPNTTKVLDNLSPDVISLFNDYIFKIFKLIELSEYT